MKKATRWRLVALLLVLCVVSTLAIRKHFFPASIKDGIPVAGGREMSVRTDVVPFLQTDPRWSDENLGPSDGKIGSYGCTLCATAMALTARDHAVDPNELNARLKEGSGYTDSGLIIWKAISKATDNRFTVVVDDRPSHEKLDRQLSQGNPVIAKVLWEGRIFHWVLITGKEGLDYLIHDPLGDGTPHDTMRDYPTGIYTIRYLKKR